MNLIREFVYFLIGNALTERNINALLGKITKKKIVSMFDAIAVSATQTLVTGRKVRLGGGSR